MLPKLLISTQSNQYTSSMSHLPSITIHPPIVLGRLLLVLGALTIYFGTFKLVAHANCIANTLTFERRLTCSTLGIVTCALNAASQLVGQTLNLLKGLRGCLKVRING